MSCNPLSLCLCVSPNTICIINVYMDPPFIFHTDNNAKDSMLVPISCHAEADSAEVLHLVCFFPSPVHAFLYGFFFLTSPFPLADVELLSFREKLLISLQGSTLLQRRPSLQEARDACYLHKERCTGVLNLHNTYYMVAGTVLVDSPGSGATLYVKAGQWLNTWEDCRKYGSRQLVELSSSCFSGLASLSPFRGSSVHECCHPITFE